MDTSPEQNQKGDIKISCYVENSTITSQDIRNQLNGTNSPEQYEGPEGSDLILLQATM